MLSEVKNPGAPPRAHELADDWVLDRAANSSKRQTSFEDWLPQRENQSLAPLLDLAAAVDDDGHILAVFHRLNGRAFGGGLDFSDL